jgi:hypothetical protein
MSRELPQTAHAIWHRVKHRDIADARELVGVCLDGWHAADAILDCLNATDDDKGVWHRPNYWKEEITILTLADVQANA